MRRFAISLLLIAVVLPYVRAPLCQVGSHEHSAHNHAIAAALTPAGGDEAATPGDCHALMACTVVLLASLAETRAGFRSFSQAWDPALQSSVAPIPSLASPDTPPPRTV